MCNCIPWKKFNLLKIKRDGSGKSRGFGFIRYERYENQQKVLREKNHVVEGRNCEVKIPHQKEESPKIFVSRITESMTKEDLSDHFSKFGDVKDVYIPRPFRSFAFVQFYDASKLFNLILLVFSLFYIKFTSQDPSEVSRLYNSTMPVSCLI